MCGLKSSLQSLWTSCAVSCCAYLGTGLVICLPPIVDLDKLTDNAQCAGKPDGTMQLLGVHYGVPAIMQKLMFHDSRILKPVDEISEFKVLSESHLAVFHGL